MMWLINLVGIALIVLIVWWFWLYRPKAVTVSGEQQLIMVENGVYAPAHIRLAAGQESRLTFLRKDASPCAESVLIPDLELSAELPLGKSVSLALPAMNPGVYPFHCQMQMYRGEITVE